MNSNCENYIVFEYYGELGTQEAEAGGSLSLRTVWSQRETLPQKTKTKPQICMSVYLFIYLIVVWLNHLQIFLI